MYRKFLYVYLCFAVGMLLPRPSAAQNDNKFTFNVGGGFTEPVRHTDSRLDPGFNLTVGAGVNLVPHFGINGEFGYNQLGVASTVLQSVGVPGGSTRIYSLTANPIIRLNPRGRFDAYLTGGGGWYRRTVEFTQPTVTSATAFDPFYGVFFPVTVPATAVVGSFSQNKGGWNVGGGVSVRVRADSNSKFYVESRYHYVYTDPIRTTILPVTFGFRW